MEERPRGHSSSIIGSTAMFQKPFESAVASYSLHHVERVDHALEQITDLREPSDAS